MQASVYGKDGASNNIEVNSEKENCGNDITDDDDDDTDDDSEVVFKANLKKEIDWKPFSSLKAHQSGVNSLHVFQISGTFFL